MLSESARMSSAAEARFRVDHPNSSPRTVKIVALDGASRPVVDALARMPWNRAAFFTALTFGGHVPQNRADQSSLGAWLQDVAGQAKDMIAEIDGADLVVMVSTAGEDAQAASVIGETCNVRGVTTIGLIIQSVHTSDAEMSRTLRHMRPFALMLVVASGPDYVVDMLAALRA